MCITVYYALNYTHFDTQYSLRVFPETRCLQEISRAAVGGKIGKNALNLEGNPWLEIKENE